MERWTVPLDEDIVAMIVADTIRGVGDTICPDVKITVCERLPYGWRHRVATAEEASIIRTRPEYAAAVAAAERLAESLEAERRRREEAIARTARELEALRQEAERHGEPGYFRFGKPPRSGRSWNYRDNAPEPGVACYSGWTLPNGGVVLDWRNVDVVSARMIWATGRPLYRIDGEVVDAGSDGEPCLDVRRSVRLPDDTVIRVVL